MIRFLTTLFICYFVICTVLFFFQRTLIYLPNKNPSVPSEMGVPEMKPIKLTAADGLVTESWYKAARDGMPTLIYFQGNAGHIGDRGFAMRPYLDNGFGVMLLGYRGYGGNPGRLSERGLYADGQAGLDYLLNNKVPAKCVVLYGESLGGGIAIELASQKKLGAVILRAPFTSMVDIGRYHYPILPVRWFLKDRYDSQDKIGKIDAPLLVFQGRQDTIVPAKFAERLYEAAKEPKQAWIYHAGGHNNLDNYDIARRTMAFVKEHGVCQQ